MHAAGPTAQRDQLAPQGPVASRAGSCLRDEITPSGPGRGSGPSGGSRPRPENRPWRETRSCRGSLAAGPGHTRRARPRCGERTCCGTDRGPRSCAGASLRPETGPCGNSTARARPDPAAEPNRVPRQTIWRTPTAQLSPDRARCGTRHATGRTIRRSHHPTRPDPIAGPDPAAEPDRSDTSAWTRARIAANPPPRSPDHTAGLDHAARLGHAAERTVRRTRPHIETRPAAEPDRPPQGGHVAKTDRAHAMLGQQPARVDRRVRPLRKTLNPAQS
jgi:hypothetical protein